MDDLKSGSVFPGEAYRQALIAALKSAGVSSVVVSFSGSGDSGSIYSVSCLAADHSQVDMVSATALMWPNKRSTFNEASSKWEVAVADLPLSIPEILESVTYDALEQSGVDWYNNDGGQGEFTIDLSVDPPGITLGVGVNYTETTTYDFEVV